MILNSAIGFNQRIVVCGSMSFYGRMIEHRRSLRAANISAIIPDQDPEEELAIQAGISQYSKRRASMRHIRRIRDSKTFGILVCNYDKHGVHDYIGANTFAEIAIAFAHYKQVFLYQGIPDFYREELLAWQAIPLYGNIDLLVNEFKLAKAISTSQLYLFDL